jgi:hypothetical protein
MIYLQDMQRSEAGHTVLPADISGIAENVQ